MLKQALQFQEQAIPAVFVVRADGEVIYKDSGKPRDMHGFLERQLRSAGAILPAAQLAAMGKQMRTAELAMKRKDYAVVAKVVTAHAGSGSYAAVPRAIDKLGGELVAQARDQAAAQRKLIDADPQAINAAVKLLQLQEAFSGHTESAVEVGSVASSLKIGTGTRGTMRAGERLRPAVEFEALRRWKEAIGEYEAAISENESELIVNYARGRIPELQKRLPQKKSAPSTD